MEQFLSRMQVYLEEAPLMAVAAAYLGGLLASLTPCVYPMIPITAGVIGGINVGGGRWRGFLLSLLYVVGMAVTYAGLGMFAALTGRFFGTINTSPWTYLLVGNIILLLSLVMLEVVNLPTFLSAPGTGPVRGPVGVFVVGMSSGLVAGPCTAPVLGTLLAYVAAGGGVLRGGVLLFVFSLGMGTLLLLVGTFSGALASLPRSGEWMVAIKKVLGLVMLLLAEYFFIQAGRMML